VSLPRLGRAVCGRSVVIVDFSKGPHALFLRVFILSSPRYQHHPEDISTTQKEEALIVCWKMKQDQLEKKKN
jgi:hypothetical protein